MENCVVFSMCVSDDLGVQIRLGVQTPAPLTKAPTLTGLGCEESLFFLVP